MRNVRETGEFVWNLATMDLAEQMNLTAAHVAHDVSEFKIAGLTAVPGTLVNVPLFHIAGIGGLVPALMLGTTSVIMPTAPFTADSTLDVVESEGVTGMFLVPAQWQVLCAHPDATAPASATAARPAPTTHPTRSTARRPSASLPA